jgi:diaminopimelate decarboxylase
MILWSKDYKATNKLLEEYGSPLYVYDAKRIIEKINTFNSSFKNFPVPVTNYFAVKALPNPSIMKIIMDGHMGFDCSSLPEITLCKKIGAKDIVFTSNNTTDYEISKAIKAGAIINFDSIDIVKSFIKNHKKIIPKGSNMPKLFFCRFNPGDIDLGSESQAIMGMPNEAKFGMTYKQIIESYKLLKTKLGIKKFGIHTMLITNELNYRYCLRISQLMFETVVKINKEINTNIKIINLGGGFGVPYRPEDPEFETSAYAEMLKEAYFNSGLLNYGSPDILFENGRWLTGDSGYLITKVINNKHTYRKYVGVDATMSNLMRPGMYGAYHFIKVLSDRIDFSIQKRNIVDVVGSLCENNDKFAVQRSLPEAKLNDILVIHTTGAHAFAMGFQYNGRLRSAEILLNADGTSKCIRRAETEEDYFRTLV